MVTHLSSPSRKHIKTWLFIILCLWMVIHGRRYVWGIFRLPVHARFAGLTDNYLSIDQVRFSKRKCNFDIGISPK